MVPKSLRTWFVIHFVLDFIFAIPLILAPRAFLGLLGWTSIDPIAARLVGAALIGIGGESYLGRNAGLESLPSQPHLIDSRLEGEDIESKLRVQELYQSRFGEEIRPVEVARLAEQDDADALQELTERP